MTASEKGKGSGIIELALEHSGVDGLDFINRGTAPPNQDTKISPQQSV
ncbi:MAG: hypothetical protein HLX50_15805 [Alteromonadaceae bacterium]|nr:hypothetical protein [Alteromonadaceae bacterium]